MAADPYNWDARVDAWEEVAATDAFGVLRDRVVREAAPRRGDRVLDLGAGTGLVTLALAPLANVTALDISRHMLERLDAHAVADGVANVDLVAGDMRSLPFDDETFDVVVSNYAFHHLDDPGKELSLSEARRVLVPGGRLVVCDMMFSLSLKPRDRRLVLYKLRAIAARGPAGLLRIVRNAGRVATGRWERPASPETWERLLTERHFADVRIELLKEEAGLATASRPFVPDRQNDYLTGASCEVASGEGEHCKSDKCDGPGAERRGVRESQPVPERIDGPVLVERRRLTERP